MTILISILLVYGLSLIITQGEIFDYTKDRLTIKAAQKNSKLLHSLVKLSNCMMCTGFHVGWLVGMFYGPFEWWNILFNGALYSGTTWILHSIIDRISR